MTDVIIDIRPFLAVGVSLLAALLIMFSDKKPNVREAWTLIAAFVKVILIFSMLPAVWHGQVYEYTLFNIVDGVGLTLRTDPAGMLFAGLSSFLWLLTSFYSIGYMGDIMRSIRQATLPALPFVCQRPWVSLWRLTW